MTSSTNSTERCTQCNQKLTHYYLFQRNYGPTMTLCKNCLDREFTRNADDWMVVSHAWII